jgi:hypothetical protein
VGRYDDVLHCFIEAYTINESVCTMLAGGHVTRYAERQQPPLLVTQLVVKFLLFILLDPTFICLPRSHCQMCTSRFLITLCDYAIVSEIGGARGRRVVQAKVACSLARPQYYCLLAGNLLKFCSRGN